MGKGVENLFFDADRMMQRKTDRVNSCRPEADGARLNSSPHFRFRRVDRLLGTGCFLESFLRAVPLCMAK